MLTFLNIFPYFVPVIAFVVVFLGRRSDEDEKAAKALGVVALLGFFVGILRHEQFNGYLMAIMTGITAAALLAYVLFRRRQAY